MQQNKFSVGLLTELAPHKHPGLLGLNKNFSEAIKLCLRTNKYDRFWTYKEVQRVLCHELTHIVCEIHDYNMRQFHLFTPKLTFVFKFKELNLKLNREVAKFEISVSEGAHYLSDHAVIYQPSFELGLEETQTYVQGGTGSGSSLDESAEE